MKFLGLNATQWTAIGKLALVGVTTVYVILAGRLAASSKRSSESAEVQGRITAELVLDRFKNRPDEPTWQITDAIEKGDVGLALRRLFDSWCMVTLCSILRPSRRTSRRGHWRQLRQIRRRSRIGWGHGLGSAALAGLVEARSSKGIRSPKRPAGAGTRRPRHQNAARGSPSSDPRASVRRHVAGTGKRRPIREARCGRDTRTGLPLGACRLSVDQKSVVSPPLAGPPATSRDVGSSR